MAAKTTEPVPYRYARKELMQSIVQSLLFDLDGTLADTAPDLCHALNRVRQEQNLAPMDLQTVKYQVSNGAGALIRLGFNIDDSHIEFEPLRKRLLEIYANNIAVHTRLFDGMESLLQYAESHGISWGVVTNKPSRFTLPLMQQLGISSRAGCIISGDTLERKKPHPDPILHACQLLGCPPEQSVYVGDAPRDIEAGNKAGSKTIVALFGYIDDDQEPHSWGADAGVHHPMQIRELVEKWSSV